MKTMYKMISIFLLSTVLIAVTARVAHPIVVDTTEVSVVEQKQISDTNDREKDMDIYATIAGWVDHLRIKPCTSEISYPVDPVYVDILKPPTSLFFV